MAALLAIFLLQMAGLCTVTVKGYENFIKPDNMSPERYQQLQLINLKDHLDVAIKDVKATEEGAKGRRVKRSHGNPEEEHILEHGEEGYLAKVPAGFYKQDSLQILKLDSLGVPDSLSLGSKTNVEFVKFVDYVDGDTITKLRFIVQKNSATATVISVEKKTDSGYEAIAVGNNDFSAFIDFTDVPDAKISDIAMGNNPKSIFNFLSITIDWPAPYPRIASDTIDEIDINKPVEIPEAATSKLFVFELRSSGFFLTQKTYDGKSLTQTSEAKDCEFLVIDNMLMLAIAQTGNDQVHKSLQKSKIYYQPNVDTDEFVEMVSEDDCEDFVTYEPKRVVQFEMKGTSCIIFVNSLLSVTESPIYCYNYQTKKFAFHQHLKTFGAQDAAYLHIRDTYPIYSESFMIVCNTQEKFNGQSSTVYPTIFKKVKGRFLPMQTLDGLSNCVNVQTLTTQADPVTVDEEQSRFKVSKLKHFVSVLLEDGNLHTYQYNGDRFVKALDPLSLVTPTGIDVINLSSTSSPDLKWFYKDNSQFKYLTPNFLETGYEMSTASTNTLKYCLKKGETRKATQSTNKLYHEFQYAPKIADLANGLQIHNLTFAEGSTLTVTEATIETRDGSDAINHVEVTLNIAVENLEVVTDGYPALVSVLNDEVITAKSTLDQLVSAVNDNDIPKVNQANNFAGPLTLVNVDGVEITGTDVQLDDLSKVLKISDNEIFDTDNIYTNMLIITGSSVPEAGQTITDTLQFENIKIAEEYNINKLHNVLVEDYVDSSDDVAITGKVTLDALCVFKDTVTSTTIDANTVDNTALLLRSGGQTMDELTLAGTANFDVVNIVEFNGANLNILDNAMSVDVNTLSITNDLTVNQLAISGETETSLKVSTDSSQIGIDFNDLLNNHMKIDGVNTVDVKHLYKSATTADISVPTIEGSSWPEEYHDIKTGTITHAGLVDLPNTDLSNGITVSSQLVDSDNSHIVNLESVNVLPFVPVVADESTVYTINAAKTFSAGLLLNAAATINGQLQGLHPTYIKNAVTDNKIVFSDPITVSDISITGDVEISNAVLTDKVMKSACSPDGCTTNDLSMINNGILRSATQIQNALLKLETVNFDDNVNVVDIDDYNPENHFVTLDGTDEITLNAMVFKDRVIFAENLIQKEDSTITACEDNAARRIYCKPQFCTDSADDKCEIINKECLIKETVANNPEYCSKTITQNIQYIMEHALKVDEEVTVSRNVHFHGGFETDTLEVRSADCSFNGVDCSSIASTRYTETFTGTNTFNGEPIIMSEATIENLSVVGTVDNVDISTMYVDSLFIDSAEQTVEILDFSSNFEALFFQPNGINVGSTDPSVLVDRNDNIDRGSDATVLSKLAFTSDVQVNKVDAVTFDGVTLEDFYTKKITSANDQEITGDLTVTNNANFISTVIKGSENALLNKIDIVNLDTKAVRTAGDLITLNNVAFEMVKVTNPRGLTVTDKFVGVDTSDIVTKYAASIHFTAHTTFTNAFTYVHGDLTFTNVQWKKTSDGISMPTDELFEFMDDSSLVNVKFTGTLTITNEPTIVNLNEKAVETRISEVWLKSVDSTINFKIEFNDLLVTGQVNLDTDVINDINIADFNNYFSKSAEQNLPGISLAFSQGLDAQAKLNTPSVTLLNGADEKGIIVGNNDAIKMKELSNKAIYLDGTTTIPVALTIDGDMAGNELNVADDLPTNSVDLSDVALTYTDTKVFNSPVTITSGANVVELEADSKIKFPTTRLDTQSHTGISLSEGSIDINYPSLKTNAVYNDANDDDISGSKTFSGTVTATGISVTGTTNTIDIGNCESNNVLLKTPCSGETPQTFIGTMNFDGDVNAVDVFLTSLNTENFDDLKANFIYKTSSDEVTFSGSNTFSTGIEVSSSTEFKGSVLGSNVDTLKTKEMIPVDMTYQSGITPPDVSVLLDHVSNPDIPEKMLTTTNFEWLADPSQRGLIKSLHSQFDQFPLHLVGLEENKDSTTLGDLKFFVIPDDYKSRVVNKITPTTSLTVTLNGEEIGIWSIYGTDTKRLLLSKGFVVTGSGTSGRIPLDSITAATTEYMALLEVDVSSGDPVVSVKQDLFSGDVTNNMVPIHIGGKSCVVVCRVTLGASVMCVNEETLDLYEFQTFDGTECYSVSASPADSSQATGTAFISMNTGLPGAEISIYKSTGGGQFSLDVQSPGLPMNIQTRLFSFEADDNNAQTLLVLLPNLDQNLDIHLYNDVTNKFEHVQEVHINNQDVQDVKFLKRGSQIQMYVLSSLKNFNLLKTYVYSGFALFCKFEALDTLYLPKFANNIDLALTYEAEDKFMITYENVGLSDASLPIGFINMMTDVAGIRSEFQQSGQIVPKVISTDCTSMVAANLKALYSADEYDLTTVGHLFLRIMPNHHVEYRAEDFPVAVKNVLEDSKFQDLIKPLAPTAVANMYEYVDDVRTPSDETYLGSISLYKENSKTSGEAAMAYLYGRLLKDDGTAPSYHAISFWKSCDDFLTQSSVDMFEAADTLPRTVDDSDTITKHQCSFVHNIDSMFSDALDNLNNKDDAGALVIHTTTDVSSSRYGCGYLKKPVTAKIQFFKDHNEENIGFDPFVQYTV